jgi:hypothetical protein
MAEADDLLDEIELAFGEDDPIVKAPPLIKVMLQDAKRTLIGDILLRPTPITPRATLTLPIPGIRG